MTGSIFLFFLQVMSWSLEPWCSRASPSWPRTSSLQADFSDGFWSGERCAPKKWLEQMTRGGFYFIFFFWQGNLRFCHWPRDWFQEHVRASGGRRKPRCEIGSPRFVQTAVPDRTAGFVVGFVHWMRSEWISYLTLAMDIFFFLEVTVRVPCFVKPRELRCLDLVTFASWLPGGQKRWNDVPIPGDFATAGLLQDLDQLVGPTGGSMAAGLCCELLDRTTLGFCNMQFPKLRFLLLLQPLSQHQEFETQLTQLGSKVVPKSFGLGRHHWWLERRFQCGCGPTPATGQDRTCTEQLCRVKDFFRKNMKK